jgi:hypothetical protein
MPAWIVPVVTLIGIILSIGITWGVMTYRQKRSETDTSNLVKDLKECVDELQDVVTDVKIMKIAGARAESKIDDHDKRIVDLEIKTAKINSPRRKR